MIIDKGGEVTTPGRAGLTPIFVAAHRGFDIIVKKLLEKKADPDALVHEKHTPLYIAIQYNHTLCVRELLNASKNDINDFKLNGHSYLSQAARLGFDDIIDVLIEHGAMVNSNEDTPPLIAAAQYK